MKRFWEKVDKSGDCWIWVAYIATNGYGMFHLNGKAVSSHVVAYELIKGPIPEGLTVDHLCRVRACVNPEHLEAVTPGENNRRAWSMRKLNHCGKGHEYTEENTYHRKNGQRSCRICGIARTIAYNKRRNNVRT